MDDKLEKTEQIDGEGSQIDSESKSSSDSFVSKVDVAKTKPSQALQKQTTKILPKKKDKVSRGRIKKRRVLKRRINTVARKSNNLKTVQLRRKRNVSVSTIASMSTSSDQTFVCQHCGHKFSRRFDANVRKTYRSRQPRKTRQKRKPRLMTKRSKRLQVGSTCPMFSPLCVKTNASPPDDKIDEAPGCNITPEMIYDTLRMLTMWRQEATTMSIMEHMKRNYPVVQDIPKLCEELLDKLTVAQHVGIVTCRETNLWSISTELQPAQNLPLSHVTLFWMTYGDTMRPVTKDNFIIKKIEKEDEQTNTNTCPGPSNNTNIHFNEDYI